MKLEIKYLFAYLPHELNVYHIDRNETLIMDCCGYGADKISILDVKEYDKPFLRQLSEFGDSDDLRKVHEFIGLGKWCAVYDTYFDAWFNHGLNLYEFALKAPYEVFQYFLANHYDVFGLIPKDLAIDI